VASYKDEVWKSATATYIKDKDSSLIRGGACCYGDIHKVDYGKYSTGLSTILFNRVVTVTDFCAPNYGFSADYGGWCNSPYEHFEMSEAAFAEIAKRKSDIVPVQYRRNWGQNWHCNVNLQQQPLSFE
ncbi:expansin-a16-like protein, partial [Trifolium pratense]